MKRNNLLYIVILIIVVTCWSNSYGQNTPNKVVAGIPVNYDEALVGIYTLSDALALLNSQTVKDAKT
jgi:hypothetical protein